MDAKLTPEVLQQRWVHSHEEDTDTEMVFRPATFNFPRSRGRKAFELRQDGSLLESGIGPTDRPQEMEGTWRVEDEDRLALHMAQRGEPERVMRILSADKDRLVVKK
jgi:hypothetical protein